MRLNRRCFLILSFIFQIKCCSINSDWNCECRTQFYGEKNVYCKNIGHQKSITPFGKSVSEYGQFTIHGNSIIDLIQKDAFLNLTFKSLIVDKLRIKTIEAGAFNNLENNIKWINLNNNFLEKIEYGTFNYLILLEILSINGNYLSEIGNDTFKGLVGLSNLELYGNQIQEINGEAFETLSNLQYLNLRGNNLRHLPDKLFANNSNLRVIDLQENYLTNISEGTFNNLHSLSSLYLSHNLFTEIDKNIFSDLKNLKSLSLKSNSIKTIYSSAFDSFNKLNHLDLGFNLIESLPKDLFRNLSSLATLNIGYNRLSNLEANGFNGLKSLSTLYLYSNKIKTIKVNSFSSLDNLRDLDLTDNKIRQLDSDVFDTCKNLFTLILSKNYITDLPNSLFKNHYSISKIYLNENFLKIIKTGTFSNLRRLEYIYLYDNQLEYLEDYSFDNLGSIYVLDLSRNFLKEIPDKSFNNIKQIDQIILNFNWISIIPHQLINSFRTTQFSIDYNHIQTIKRESFKNSRIKYLSMKNNNISVLEDGCFSSINNLYNLALTQNKIKDISNRMFGENYKNIKYLDLSFNSIENLNYPINFEDLYLLDLSNNGLRLINKNFFKGMKSIYNLNMNNNQLKDLDPNLFSYTSITYLRLANNQLNSSVVSKIKTDSIDLFLNGNPLKKFPNLLSSSNLRMLQLENTMINEFDVSLIPSVIDEIYLDNNQITKVYNVKLSLKNWKVFSLANGDHENNLNSINFCDKGYLNTINIFYVKNVNLSDFINCKSLKSLIISHSKEDIHELKLPMNLRKLKLNYDNLTDNFSIYNLPDLESLNLANNLIENVENMLLNLSKLRFLNCSNNIIKKLGKNLVNKLSIDIETLIFDNNIITEIEEKTFQKFASLRILSLNNNRLKNLEFFGNYVNIPHLYLNYNNFVKVDFKYRKFRNFQKFTMKGNKLKYMNEILISSRMTVLLLDFSENLLENFPKIISHGVKTIDFVNFKRNLIQDISDENIDFKVNTIDLSFNKLTHMPRIQNKIYNMNLEDNRINELECNQFRYVNNINLGNNCVNEVNDKKTSYFSKKSTINLSGNLLSLLPTCFIDYHSINLYGNPLGCDCTLKEYMNSTCMQNGSLFLSSCYIDNYCPEKNSLENCQLENFAEKTRERCNLLLERSTQNFETTFVDSIKSTTVPNAAIKTTIESVKETTVEPTIGETTTTNKKFTTFKDQKTTVNLNESSKKSSTRNLIGQSTVNSTELQASEKIRSTKLSYLTAGVTLEENTKENEMESNFSKRSITTDYYSTIPKITNEQSSTHQDININSTYFPTKEEIFSSSTVRPSREITSIKDREMTVKQQITTERMASMGPTETPSRCPVNINTCKCIEEKLLHKIICTDIGFYERVPIFRRSNVLFDELRFTGNSTIQTIQRKAFKNILLSSIILEGIGIENIEEQAFEGVGETLSTLILTGNNVKKIAKDTFKGLKILNYLDLSNNSLRDIHKKSFVHLLSIQILSLGHNSIVNVPETLLNSSNFLRTIDLSYNNIKSLKRRFSKLYFVASIDLSYNSLDELEENVIPATTREIDLSGNNISKISPIGFSNSFYLRKLNLSNNGLNIISPGAFDYLSELFMLDLSNNALDIIPSWAFSGSGLRKLKILSLSKNNIQKLDANVFKGLKVLENLDLSFNYIKQIKSEIFIGLPNLLILNLSHNLIEKIRDEYFSEFEELRELDLSYNKLTSTFRISRSFYLRKMRLSHNNISEINSQAFDGTYLKEITLDNNKLEKLDVDTFFLLISLEKIDLSWNNIKTIHYYSINFCDNLQILDLSHNNLESLSDEKRGEFILENIRSSIKHIDLSYNRLQTLPNFVNDFSKLESLILFENDWKCDCNLKWVRLITNKIKIDEPVCYSPLSRKNMFIICYDVKDDLSCSIEIGEDARCIQTTEKSTAIQHKTTRNLILDTNYSTSSNEILSTTESSSTTSSISVARGSVTSSSSDSSRESVWQDTKNFPSSGPNTPSTTAPSSTEAGRKLSIANNFPTTNKQMDSTSDLTETEENFISTLFSTSILAKSTSSLEESTTKSDLESIGATNDVIFPEITAKDDLSTDYDLTTDQQEVSTQYVPEKSYSIPNIFFSTSLISESSRYNDKITTTSAENIYTNSLQRKTEINSISTLTNDEFQVQTTQKMTTEANILSTIPNVCKNRFICPPQHSKCSCPYGYRYRKILCESIGNRSYLPYLCPSETFYTELRIFGKSCIKKLGAESFKNLILESIYLEGICIEEVENDAFTGPHSFLQEIHLKNNNIKSCDGKTFEHLHNLNLLDLSNNNLEYLTEECLMHLGNLETLKLSNNFLENLPRNMFKLNKNLKEVDLSNNLIASISDGTFNGSCSLSSLDLSRNNLKNFDTLSFNVISNTLKELSLHENGLETMPKEIFNDLRVLNYLDLSDNLLKDIHDSYFSHLINLETLNIQYNLITNLRPAQFEALNKLKVLILSKNRISTLTSLTFSRLKVLENLDLSENVIEEFDNDIFDGLNYLKLLDISSNRLNSIPSDFLRGLPNLKKLILSKNKLQTINKLMLPSEFIEFNIKNNTTYNASKIFVNHTKLEMIDLSYNNLQILDNESFSQLPSLLQLNLSYNKIENIHKTSFNGLDSLKIIDLSDNKLKEVPWQSFKKLPLLSILLLKENNISSLENSIFTEMNKIKILNFKGNRIKLLKNEFFKGLDKLRNLDLSNNLIRRLDIKILNNLKNVMFFNISGNKLEDIIPDHTTKFYSLYMLDLSRNKLESIPAKCFSSFISLKKLYIMNNLLKNISEDAFFGLTYLDTLSVSNNFLDAKIINSFAYLRSIKKIELNDNPLISIKVNEFPQSINNLQSLHLRSTALNYINETSFTSLSQLRILDLGRNNLTDESFKSIEYLPSLRKLYLDHNRFTKIFFKKGLKKVIELEMSSNLLTSGKLVSLSEMHSLQSLTLSFNKLTSIPVITFTNLTSLQSLNVAGNNLSAKLDESLKSFNKLKYLEEVNMGHCSLSKLYAFTDLRYWKKIHLDGNKIEIINHDTFKNSRAEYISLRDVGLKKLPESILKLKNLKYLDVSSNFIDNTILLPKKMNKLYYLNISLNNAQYLKPKNAKFSNLKSFDGSSNKFTLNNNTVKFYCPFDSKCTINLNNNKLKSLQNIQLRGSFSSILFSNNNMKNITEKTWGKVINIDNLIT